MLCIRLVNSSDCENIFNLSNDLIVRSNSINKEQIPWDSHKEWFKERIKNVHEPFYVIEDNNGEFIAQVRFDKRFGENIISISIKQNFRGKGYGKEIIKECSIKSNLSPIYALVNSNNIISKNAFIKAGYKEQEIIEINNEQYFKLVLLQ